MTLVSLDGLRQEVKFKRDKKIWTAAKFMGKMINHDSILRPRRIAFANDNDKFGKGALPINTIANNHLRVNVTPFDYPGLQNFQNKKSKNQYKKSVQGKLLQEFELYCEKTTLHGLRYVGDSNLTFCERCFWLIAFSVAIAFATYYIKNIYDKWNSSPVIISFSPFDAQLKDIPFPAVTICNMNQAKRSEVTRIRAEGNPKEIKLLDDICNSNETYNATDTTGYNWTNLRNFLIKVGNSCSDMLKQCKWSSNIRNCDELFNNDLTDEGLCCSFNRLPPKYIFRNPSEVSLQLNQTYSEYVYDWTPESGFPDSYNDTYIPKRPLGAGAHLGLSVVLDAQIDEYYCSSTSSIGFKIIIGNPIETPKMADYGTLLSPGVEARFSIKPSFRQASQTLRSVPVDKRQCYFANERKLAYYRTYSKMNCQLECASKVINKTCGCVPYYLPKDPVMTICEQKDSECVRNSQIRVLQDSESNLPCKCFSQCSSLVYTTRNSYGRLNKTVDRAFDLETIIQNSSTYTQRNCYLECISNYTLQQCKCVPYYLPRSRNITACGRKEKNCIEDAKEDMETITGSGKSCNCLPGCFELVFSETKSFGNLSPLLNASINKDEWYSNNTYVKDNFVVVHFFFPTSKFSKQVKAELFGFTEILSNIGGLLGLCMGFSFLSIIEIIYFITVKLFCKWLLKNRKKKVKKDENILFNNDGMGMYPFLK